MKSGFNRPDGGKWQQLQPLRAGKHPKDMVRLADPVPEVGWSMQTVSDVNTAMAQTRQREDGRGTQCSNGQTGSAASSATRVSKLDQVEMRMIARLQNVQSGQKEDSTSRSCTRSSCASSISRFEAVRQRIMLR